MQNMTESKLSDFDASHNRTATTLTSLSSQFLMLQSNQALIQSEHNDLDIRHNTTAASVDFLNSEVINLKSLLEMVNTSTLSALALQETQLNTTATTLSLVAVQLSNLKMTIDLVNDTHGITRSELTSLDEKLNMTARSLAQQITSLKQFYVFLMTLKSRYKRKLKRWILN